MSDDGQDFWTWTERQRLGTSPDLVGSLDRLNEDYRSPALFRLTMRDAMFRHQPSSIWAAYDNADVGSRSFGEWLEDRGMVCYGASPGIPMSAGTLELEGRLCDTDLYVNAFDQDGTTGCDGEYADDAWGPAWNTRANDGCPLDDPGITGSLGLANGGATELPTLGFASPLGLNTGVDGAGQNAMRLFVR